MSQVTLEKITETRYRAKVSATAEFVSKARKESIKKIKTEKTLPGFRKGKAPDHLILKKYPEQIREQQISQLVYGYLPEVSSASENGLSEIIKVENIHLHDDHGAYELIFDTRPYAEIGKVKSIKLIENSYEVTEEEVNKEIKDVLQRNAEYEEKEGAAESGDKVVIDIEVLKDGVPEGEVIENREYVLGSSQLDADLEKDILEKPGKAGDEFEFKKEIEDENGKTQHHNIITIKTVKKAILPELTDEIAAKSFQPAKTTAEVPGTVKDRLLKLIARQDREKQLDQAIKDLQGTSTVHLPESYLQAKVQEFIKERNLELTSLPEDMLKNLHEQIEAQERTQVLVESLLRKAAEENESGQEDRFETFLKAELDETIANSILQYYEARKAGKELGYIENSLLSTMLTQYNQKLLFDYIAKAGSLKKGSKPLTFADLKKTS